MSEPRAPRYPGSPHPFETGQPQGPPQVIITDESDKGPDQAKKPTSWVPDQKVAYGPIGAGLALLFQQVGARYGFDMSPTEAIVYAMLLIALVQFWLPKKDGS